MKCHWGPTDEQGYCKRLSSDNDGNECSQQFCWPDCDDETETECWNGQDDNGCDKGSFCVKNEDVIEKCDFAYDYYGEYGDGYSPVGPDWTPAEYTG